MISYPRHCYITKNLIVWQKAMELVRIVYRLSKAFPAEERYALTDQLRRAAVSVPSNIAEGNGRAGNRDYAHFLSIARGSLFETMTQLEIAEGLGYLNLGDADFAQADQIAGEVNGMLTAMLRKYGAFESRPRPFTSTST